MPPQIVIRDLPDIWRTKIPLGTTGLLASGPIIRLVVHNQGYEAVENLRALLKRIECLDQPEDHPGRFLEYRDAPMRWGGQTEGNPKNLHPDDYGFLELIRAMDLNLLMDKSGLVIPSHPDLPPGKFWQVNVAELVPRAIPELRPYSGRFALHFDFVADNLPREPRTVVVDCNAEGLVPNLEFPPARLTPKP